MTVTPLELAKVAALAAAVDLAVCKRIGSEVVRGKRETWR